MRIIVAITAASGSIYARLTIERLLRCSNISEIALIYSTHAKEVVAFERVNIPSDSRIKEFDNEDMFAPVASGSARYDAMVIVPCSAGTLARAACGVSQSLLERAADVMLKERRRVIFVLRESPLSLIHIRNMATLTEAGGTILPASPSFYSHPQSIDELCMTTVERIIAQLGIDSSSYEWRGRE